MVNHIRYFPQINYDDQTYFDEDAKRWYSPFHKRGYSNSFVSTTNLNVLMDVFWQCYGSQYIHRHHPELYESKDQDLFDCKNHYENVLTKIRMSEETDLVYDGEPVRKYMYKSNLEKLFKIKLTAAERLDPELIAAFHLNDYGFFAIFDTLAVMKRRGVDPKDFCEKSPKVT